MSIFRSKAEQVYAQGALERGEFTPTGAPKSVYQYWASHAKHVPKTENFCHFWRVVVFWAPLMRLRQAVGNLFEHNAAWYAVAAAIVGTLVVLGALVSPGFLAPLAIVYVVAGFVLATDKPFDEMKKTPGLRKAINITAPVSYPVHYLVRVLRKVPEDVFIYGGLGIALLLIGALLVGLIIEGAHQIGWWTLAYVIGVPLAGLAVVVAVVILSNLIDKWKYNRKVKDDELFDKYIRGEISHEDYFGTSRREPTRLGLWLKRKTQPIRDFGALFWNIIRVNKWKICPIVKIDS